jgi:acetyl esterase/lipase
VTSPEPVDPALAALFETLPTGELTEAELPNMRAFLEAMALFQPEADAVSVQRLEVPGPEGAPDVKVVITRPAGVAGALPLLVWMHGGGYVAGSPDIDQGQMNALAEQVGCAVASVDYRLAPETPYPGPIEDCYAVLTHLQAHAEAFDVDATRIAVGGESAGGGLAAALALLARDRGEVPLLLQVLVYPMLDDRTCSRPPGDWVGEYLWRPGDNSFGWRCLLGDLFGTDDVPPYAAAGRATDLAGLPPTFIDVGTLDLFLYEDVAYARALLRAGVPTELQVYPGAPHGFLQIEDAWMSRRHHDSLRAALRRAFAR